MKKLNILLVSNITFNLTTSGSTRVLLTHADLLSKRGHNVSILMADSPNNKLEHYNKVKIYRIPSVPFPATKKAIYISLPVALTIMKIIKKEKIDVIDVGMPFSICLNLAKVLGIASVTHAHMQPENILIDLPKMMQGKRITNMVHNYMINVFKKSDLTVCPSEFSQSILKKFATKLKTKVISNGVDLSTFKKEKFESFLDKYRIPKGKKKILTVGRLAKEKDIKTLIKAMPLILKKSKDFHLIVVGNGVKKDKLKSLAKELKVNKQTTFTGKVSEKDLVKAYNSCDVFVLPSLIELEGLVVLEAMACGKPIIVANSKESASRFFVKNNGFLFKPKDPKDLADKLIKMFSDDRLRKKMGRESYKKALSLDINKSIDKLINVYYSVLKK